MATKGSSALSRTFLLAAFLLVVVVLCGSAFAQTANFTNLEYSVCVAKCPGVPPASSALGPPACVQTCLTDPVTGSICCNYIYSTSTAQDSTHFGYCSHGAGANATCPNAPATASNANDLTPCLACSDFPLNPLDGYCVPGICKSGTAQALYVVEVRDPIGKSTLVTDMCDVGIAPPTATEPTLLSLQTPGRRGPVPAGAVPPSSSPWLSSELPWRSTSVSTVL